MGISLNLIVKIIAGSALLGIIIQASNNIS